MTWAKYGGEYCDELAFAGVTDGAFRLHTEAIHWLYRLESDDLRIPRHLLRRFAGCLDPDQAAKELVSAQLWRDHGDAYEVVHHAEVIHQSIAAQRAKRDQDRERQRRYRAKQESRGESRRDVPATQSDSHAGTTRTGKTAVSTVTNLSSNGTGSEPDNFRHLSLASGGHA